jgi:hypothetical protein
VVPPRSIRLKFQILDLWQVFMTRRLLLKSSSHVRSAQALASLACALVPMHTPVQADDGEMASKPIVALSKPAGDGDFFMHFLSANTADSGPNQTYMRRALGVATAASEPLKEKPAAKPAVEQRSIIVAEADPYFDRWQKDADERLKQEGAARKPKQHPFAAEHPDKSVIVCEAGCATTKDEIVYMAAYVQALPPTRQLEPSSSDQGAVNTSQSGDAQSGLDEGSLPCVAGCYDKSEPAKPATRNHADIEPATPLAVTLAAASPTTEVVAKTSAVSKLLPVRKRLQLANNGAIVEGRTAHRVLRQAHSKKFANAVARAMAKPKASSQTASQIAVKPQRASMLPKTTPISAFKTTVIKARVLKARALKANMLRPWRTKVVTASAVAPTHHDAKTRTPALHALKKTRLAVRPLRYARANTH